MTCKDCLHHACYVEDLEDTETCNFFLDKNKYVEIVYGQWEYDPNGTDWAIGAWRCSLCKAKNDNLGMDKNINPYLFVGSKFCPHCGAKMKKEGDIKC